MAIVRTISLVAGVLGVSLVLAACGGKTGGTTTNPTEASAPTTTSTQEETAPEREETTTAKAAPEKAEKKAEKTTAEAEGAKQNSAALKQGEEVFNANGCGSCHTLAAAGAGGAVGPDLDETLPGKSTEFIRESIVDPNAEVAPGYSAGIMPPNFGSTLSSAELEALVTYLKESAGK